MHMCLLYCSFLNQARYSSRLTCSWLCLLFVFVYLYVCILSVLIANHVNEAVCIYRIVQNFDGGNFDVFDVFRLDRQNLTHQIV